MKKLIYSTVAVAIFILALNGCGEKKKTEDAKELIFNSYVEAFTSGKISRHSPMYLVLSQDVTPEKLNLEDLNKVIKIKPSIEGEFTTENGHTIVFKPKTEFNRDTKYEVTADLSKVFPEAKDKEKSFTFRFNTLPFAVRANVNSFDIAKGDENAFDINCTILTPDKETPETVEEVISFSEKVNAIWQHSSDGRKHELKIQGVAAQKSRRNLKISLTSNKLGADKGEVLKVEIPAQDEFYVFKVDYQSTPERFVEVTFTKTLDPSQSLYGLVSIMDNESNNYSIDNNKIRLYPDNDKSGALRVYVNENIKSKDKKIIGADAMFTVDVGDRFPKVNFIGNGVVIPQSDQLMIPFQAVYLRGVTVKVIKILEQNIGQFLQINNLDGNSELMRVGRIVARKTIFLNEDPNNDLTRVSTYALDLRQLMQPEPGAIYRVELSFNRQLSAYPCDETERDSEDGEGFRIMTREEIEAQDVIKFKEDASGYEDGSGYYYYDNDDYYYYDYDERNNPCDETFYYGKSESRNVMASNLGVMAMAGENDGMTVLVHNLLDTKPESGVDIRIYNYQNQLMGEGKTDASGRANVALKGRPYYVIASQGQQRGYMRVDKGSSLSLSSFDVSGEVVQKGIKGFIYGERGVWRPGDTLHLGFMLNDRIGNLPAEHPVVMELYNPLGQIYQTRTRTRGELGLYTFNMPTDADAPTGAWEARVKVGGVTFSKRLRVEAIKPNRLKIDLNITDKVILKGESSETKMHVEWLQGATARNLGYSIDATFTSITTAFDDYKNYTFDDPSRKFESEEVNLISGTTDEKGDAKLGLKLDQGAYAPGMLMANIVTKVFEESGDFSIDAFRVQYSPFNRYVGIESPQKDREQLNTGKSHTFQLVSVNHKGKAEGGTKLNVEVYKVDWYWWWSSSNSSLANYMSDSHKKTVKDFDVTTDSKGRAKFDLNFSNDEWGTYYIRVRDLSSGHSTGMMSYFDWPYGGRRDADGASAATMLSFKTDKTSYKPGEKMSVTIPSSEGSRAVVCIQNGAKVLAITEHECKKGETTIKVEVTSEMQPNAYVFITLLQPYGITTNDLPIRLYGVVPFSVSSDESHLNPVIGIKDELRPESKYEVTVSEKSGKEMAYTLAIVDEGLLDLTRFKTPDPWRAFNAREALGVNTWDIYNFIVGAYGGRIEQLFSIGGDDALDNGPKAIVNRFKPVVQFEGPFHLKKGGKMKHKYEMPNYNGRVRVMVVAGNGQAYGCTDKSVFVRKPVMVIGTLPRVIGVGEEMKVPATVFATEDNIGNVDVTLTCSDNMEIVGGASQSLNFTTKGDKQAAFRIKVKSKPGTARVKIVAKAKGETSVYETDIEIRSVRRPQTRVTHLVLEAGSDIKQTINMPGADGTNKLTLEVSDVEPLNLGARLSYLLGYPHGCVEQITSKSFPQLYLKQLAELTKDQTRIADEAVRETIRRLRSYQTAEGGFAYWPGGTSTNAWGTVYASHFLFEAEAKGYQIPEVIKNNVLANMKKIAREWKSVSNSYSGTSEEMTQAYRLYVLALAQNAELGAMNRMKEQPNLSQMSRWMLATAYSRVGRKDVAQTLSEKTINVGDYRYGTEYDLTFGSDLRDKSIILQSLCLLDKGNEAAIAAREISKELASDKWISTQSTAFSLMAISDYMNKYKTSSKLEFSFSCGGKKEKVSTEKHVWSGQLLENTNAQMPIEVKNNGKSTVFVRVITEGTPMQGEEIEYANGLGLVVNYVDNSGNPVDVANLAQGTNFTAVVTVKNPLSSGYNNIVLTQIFPSGWEILNTRYLNEGATDTNVAGVSYQDIRDDRVYSYFDRLPAGRQIILRVNLCAVYPGSFYLPPVFCEAMYDNLVRANTRGIQVKVE